MSKKKRTPQVEERGLSVEPSLLRLLQIGRMGGAGVPVTEKSALALTAVWCAVQVISANVAALSLKVYQHLPNDERREARDHPAWRLLQVSPDKRVSAVDWFQTLMAHALLRGNGLAEIRRDGTGKPTSLHHFDYRDTEIKEVGDELVYTDRKTGKTLWARDVLHLRHVSLDGVNGLSPIRALADSLSGVMAADQYSQRVYANNSTPSGVWELPPTWKPDAIANFEKKLAMDHGGVENAGKHMTAYAGSKFTPIEFSPADAQLILSRQFGVTEVCRAFNIQPHKLFDLSRSTFSNIEEQDLDFYQTTLAPWATRLESEINLKLVDDPYYAEHGMESILRGRHADRLALYQGLANLGVITPNQIAKKENLPGIGPDGDKPLIPLNKGTLGEEQPAPSSSPSPAPEISSTLRAVYVDDLRRLTNREAQAVTRAVRRDPAGFRPWAEGYYRDFPATCLEYLGNSTRALALVGSEVRPVETYASERSRTHLDALVELVVTHPPGELEPAVDALCKSWKEAQ